MTSVSTTARKLLNSRICLKFLFSFGFIYCVFVSGISGPSGANRKILHVLHGESLKTVTCS